MSEPKRKPLPKVDKGTFRLPVGGSMSKSGRLRGQQASSQRQRKVEVSLAGKTKPTPKA